MPMPPKGAEPVTEANTDSAYMPEIFPPDEEKQLLEESNTEKTSANKTFTSGDYNTAIQGYERALAACPTYLEYDIAVLRSNISACHIKLEEWKEAVESATKALDALDRLDPPNTKEASENGRGELVGGVSEIDDSTELLLEALTRTGRSINDIYKLRTKALLRSAKISIFLLSIVHDCAAHAFSRRR